MSDAQAAQPLLGQNVSKAINAEGSQTYVRYRRRWLTLSIVLLLQMSNAMLWLAYSPIANIAAEHYNTSAQTINWLSLLFMVVYIPIGPVAMWCLDTKGLRYSLILASAINMVGAWIRFAGEQLHHPDAKLSAQFVGSFFAAAAQPLILGCPTLLAGTWFGEAERAMANTIMSISNPLGIAIASVISPIIVSKPSEMGTLMMVFAIPATVGFVVCVFLFKDKPPTPPSASAHEESHPFFEGLRLVFRSPAFVMLFLAFGIGLGIFNAVSTLLAQMIAPQGYTPNDAGTFGGILIGSGLVGAGIAGAVLDCTGAFLTVERLSYWSATATFVLFTLANKPDRWALMAAACGGMGFFCFAVLPTSLELGVEITYPIGEATSAGFLFLGGNIFGILFILLMEYPLLGPLVTPNTTDVASEDPFGQTATTSGPPKSYPDMTNSCWFLVAAGLTASLLTTFIKTDYKRRISEKK
eukprot:m.84733 g.84733  ORF g.84733 m.84733 type:complete len:468 (+) comp12978_c0_seq1:206-1609(+)